MKTVYNFNQLPNVVRRHRFDYNGKNGPVTCFFRLIKNPHPIDHQYAYTVAWTTEKAPEIYLTWNAHVPMSDEDMEKMVIDYFSDL